MSDSKTKRRDMRRSYEEIRSFWAQFNEGVERAIEEDKRYYGDNVPSGMGEGHDEYKRKHPIKGA
jgi:hypothetical protein